MVAPPPIDNPNAQAAPGWFAPAMAAALEPVHNRDWTTLMLDWATLKIIFPWQSQRAAFYDVRSQNGVVIPLRQLIYRFNSSTSCNAWTIKQYSIDVYFGIKSNCDYSSHRSISTSYVHLLALVKFLLATSNHDSSPCLLPEEAWPSVLS